MTPEEEAMTKRILELKALLPGGLPASNGVQEPMPAPTIHPAAGMGSALPAPPAQAPAPAEEPVVMSAPEEEPVVQPAPVIPQPEVALAEVPAAMIPRPDKSILDENWDDVREDRMGDPVGWATDEADARAQYEARLEQLDPTQRQGYSFEAFTDQKNREQRDADEGAERQARTEWAQERQQARADDKEWGMKSTMPPEVLAEYEDMTPEQKTQFYSMWYKKQRALGLTPGDTDSNLQANAKFNENIANPNFPKQRVNPVAEEMRLENIAKEQVRDEKFANNLERVEANKEREADRLHAYRNWMMEGSAFGDLPYAQRVAIGRHIATAADPNAPLEARDVANRRLLAMGVLANGGVVAEAPIQIPGVGGQGVQGAEPTPDEKFNAGMKLDARKTEQKNQLEAQADGSAPVNSDYMQKKIDEYWNTNPNGTWAEIDAQLANDPNMSGTNNEEARRANIENEIAHAIVTGIRVNWENLPKDSIDRLKSSMILLGVPGVNAEESLTWEQFEEFAGKWVPANEQARKDLKDNFEAIQKQQLGAKPSGGFFGANDLGQQDVLIA